jgi:hypothetical protein
MAQWKGKNTYLRFRSCKDSLLRKEMGKPVRACRRAGACRAEREIIDLDRNAWCNARDHRRVSKTAAAVCVMSSWAFTIDVT